MHSLPQYGTRRRPERRTIGAMLPGLTSALGVRPMPWQQHAADVAGELVTDPETGLDVLAYRTVVLSVGRRGGKSLSVLLRLLQCLFWRPPGAPAPRGWYTAQTRTDGSTTLRDDWMPQLRSSLLADAVSTREGAGYEALHGNGGIIRLFSPLPKSLHGQPGDLIVFDEAWAHSRELGAELEKAARPLMATRSSPQQWIVTAAGDADSTWWLDWLDAGRDAAAADTGTGICHIEYTAEAPGLDPHNPEHWPIFHPAVRTPHNPYGTIGADFLAEEHDRDPVSFVRLYGNVNDRAAGNVQPIPVERWQAASYAGSDPDRDQLIALGVACDADQKHTAVVASIVLEDGTTVVEVVDHQPGSAWAVPRLVELCDRYEVEHVALDRSSPAGVIYEPAQRAGVPMLEMQLRDVTAACAGFSEAVGTTVAHVPHPALDAAVEGAQKRPVGDGSWLWRLRGDSDASPLMAASLARAAHPWVYGPVNASIG